MQTFRSQRLIASALRVFMLAVMPSVSLNAEDAAPSTKRLDVCDVSILWPAPKTAADVASLISVVEKLDGDSSTIWPDAVFRKVLATAQGVTVTGSGIGVPVRQIKFRDQFQDLQETFETPVNWKIAGIRIDPSAPGCSSRIIQLFGSRPQIRLIVQPVTVDGARVTVHDVTAHLVFDFASGSEPAVLQGLPPRSIPDREKFKAILDDLAALKADAGVSTGGALGVHPALRNDAPAFAEKVKGFLKKHLAAERLNAVAFMGLDAPEPWIFFAMARQDGVFSHASHPSLPPRSAQMLSFRDGDHVTPRPSNSTFGKGLGVSTAQLFDLPLNLDAAALPGPIPPGLPAVAHRDVPDIIANPGLSHFFNTDCLSCHSESTRRQALGLHDAVSPFQFKRPTGISGVDGGVLARQRWNVRNFGWFPDFLNGGAVVESVSMRTANEAAESAEFINREYFGAPADSSVTGTASNPGTPSIIAAASTPVANALTLVMTIKSPEDRARLKELITTLQALPPESNPIARALTKLGNVHFARFVFIGDDKLAVITTYDDDFESYIRSFVDEIGGVFDQLLTHMKDAPPLPVEEHVTEFLEYVK